MKRILSFIFLLFASAVLCGADVLQLYSSLERDSDLLSIERHSLSSEKTIGRGTIGLWSQRSLYHAPEGEAVSAACGGRFRYVFSRQLETALAGGAFGHSGGFRPLAGGGLVYSAQNGFRTELYAAHEPVETLPALDKDISLTSWGAAGDIPVVKNVLLVAGGDIRFFSDKNERQGITMKGIYETPVGGLSLQAWYRAFRDSKETANGYFNPRSMEYQRFVLSLRERIFGDWKLFLLAGPGIQRIDEGETTGTFYFKGSLEKAVVRNLSLRLDYLYSDSAYDASPLSYRYSSISAAISCRLP